jgi:hypothetical protein
VPITTDVSSNLDQGEVYKGVVVIVGGFFGWGMHRRPMVVEYPTTYAIIAYHHESCEFESCSLRGVLDTILCDKVCQ